MTFAAFVAERESSWLITYEKIEGGRRLADLMQVPFWGFLYFVKDHLLLAKKLYDPKAGWLAAFEVRCTETQATVNGGNAKRFNAFIDMRGSIEIRASADDAQ
jgi:hypothetical protein